MLGCDTQIVCIDVVPCFTGNGLIVSVDVEQYWGKDTSLGKVIHLVPPSDTFIVQYHIESSAGQHILNDHVVVTVLSGFLTLLNQDPMTYCVVLRR